MNYDFARRLRIRMDPVLENLNCLYGADSKPIKILGTCTIDIGINGLTTPTTFQIVPNLVHNIILGLDWIKENHAVIDFALGSVSLYDNLVTTAFIDVRPLPKTYVRLHKSVLIPPQSEAFVRARIDVGYRLTTSLLEPLECLFKKNITLARSVVLPKNDFVTCKFLNPSNLGVYLKRGWRVATIEPVVIPELNNIETIGDSVVPGDNPTAARGLRTGKEILQDLGVVLDPTQVSPEDMAMLTQFLVDNCDVFAKNKEDLPGTNLVQHRIETGSALPIRQRAYKTTPANRLEIEEQVQSMLKSQVIQESNSPWQSPVILVPKKDKSYRFAIDYRRLNDVTESIFFPLPTMEDIIDVMSENQVAMFSSLDFLSGFHQIILDPDTAAKTGFSTHLGSYQYNRLPFGLKNAPASFQSLMHTVLRRLLFKYCLVYLDDVIIFSKDLKEHLDHLSTIFSRIREANLKLNGKKCQFGLPKVHYLGHILSGQGVHADPQKTQAMRDFPRPTSVKTLKGFLGLCGYYRRFVKGFAQIATPMHKLLRKDTKWVWTDDCEAAFLKMKEALCTAPILRFADMNKMFYLVTDASYTAISYCLCQEGEGGILHPIGFGGRSLNKSESNWTVTEIEFLAIICGIKYWSQHLSNKKFVIKTDHVSLKYIRSMRAEAGGRIARWCTFIQGYDFEVVHTAGKLNLLADTLSRREYEIDPKQEDIDEVFADMLMNMEMLVEQKQAKPKSTVEYGLKWLEEGESERVEVEEELNVLGEEQTVVMSDVEDIGPLQRTCQDFAKIYAYLEKGDLPTEEKLAKRTILESERYCLLDNRLYHLREIRDKRLKGLKPIARDLCIPRSLRQEIMEGYHDKNAHVGTERLYQSLQQNYYWPAMFVDVHKWISTCTECQQAKLINNAKKAPLIHLPSVPVFDRVHLDIVGPMPTSTSGNKYLLIIIDSASRFPLAIPLKDQSAETVCDALFDNLFCLFGAPLSICSDLGKNFTSAIMKVLCKRLGVK